MKAQTSIITCLCLAIGVIITEAQHEPRPPESYKEYELLEAYKEQNMCPYLKVAGANLPVLCWVCGVPMKFLDSDKYQYDCCPGYEKSELIDNKCLLMETTWKTIVKYLRDRGNVQTAAALNENTGIPDLDNDPAAKVYTVIVPSQDNDIKTGEVDYAKKTGENTAAALVVPGRHYSRDFMNGKTVKNVKNMPIKVTTYSNGLTFLDCHLLRSPDHETTNGLVHFVDGALGPTYEYPTVLSRLENVPDLVDFARDLPADLRRKLGDKNSAVWYTVFAPKNREWGEIKAKLGGRESIEELAKQHILPKMICAQAITQRSGLLGPTMANNKIGVTLTEASQRAVIDACGKQLQIKTEDLMAGNGVVHVIESAMTPTKHLDLKSAVTCLGGQPENKIGRAAREIAECDISDPSGGKTIALIPDESAFKWAESSKSHREQYSRFGSDRSYRCNVYKYHMLTAPYGYTDDPNIPGISQEVAMKTEYTAPNGQATFVTNTYTRERDGSKLHFNTAPVRSLKPVPFKNGKIFFTEKINFPPEKTIIDVVTSQPNMGNMTKKLKNTGYSSELSKMSPNVLFLPSIDMGWSTRDLENGYSNEQTRKLLQLHTIPHAMFGGKDGFTQRESIQEVESALPDRSGGKVKVIIKRQLNGNTFIGHKDLDEKLWSMVLDFNKVATDGVVWIVDWPIKCPPGLC